MDQNIFLKEIQNPKTYDQSLDKIDLIQTHISYVIITDRFVYKIKKPVDFGFLNFSTLELRKKFCYEEIKLNKRLCDRLYIDVVTLTKKVDKSLEINGEGDIIDYAVRMNKFSQDKLMSFLLKNSQISKKHLDNLCSILLDFYNSYPADDEITSYGSPESVKKNIDENFEQTQNMINITIPEEMFNNIKKANNVFFKNKKELFKLRMKNGFIHDCHGDLHSGNIVIDNQGICVFDCIEFNKRFRYIDVASDIGFLAMDLDYNNHPFYSSFIISKYIEISNDKNILKLINFYKSYRAFVRGKVGGFQLNDPQIKKIDKEKIITSTRKYFELSHYYSKLFNLEITNKKPIIFLTSGLTGTGKSTVASKISIDFNAETINTDIIRKKQEGINIYERHHEEPNTGLYSPEKIKATYEKVINYAEEIIKKRKNVVIDATFQKRKYREMVYNLSKKYNAIIIPIYCHCPENISKQWLNRRLQLKSISDGRWEIYLAQKETYEYYTDDEYHIKYDTSNLDYETRMKFFNEIINRIIKS